MHQYLTKLHISIQTLQHQQHNTKVKEQEIDEVQALIEGNERME